MYDKQETMDNLAWDRMDEREENGQKQLIFKTTCRKVEQLIFQQLKCTATLIPPLIVGGFNFLYRVRVAGMPHDVMVRLALPGPVHLPIDKTRQEAATASLVAKATTIPLPRILHHGQDPTFGPYLIIEHLEHDALMLDRIDDWVTTYEPRLQIWLAAMERAEKETASLKDQDLSAPLSQYMRESWATGRFWLSYATRKTRLFDSLYWKYLDERFSGARKDSVTKDELWKTRVHLLSEKERDTMEELVQRKMEDMKERKIVDWDLIEAQQDFAKFLVE